MSKYRVCIEMGGYVERYVEAEDEDKARDIAIDSLDWDDVYLSCDRCYEVRDEPRRIYRVRKKGDH